MTVSFSKLKRELLIDDSSFIKKNASKTLIGVLCINFCLAITFFSLYMAKTENECTLYPPTTKKDYCTFVLFLKKIFIFLNI